MDTSVTLGLKQEIILLTIQKQEFYPSSIKCWILGK